MTDAGLTPQQQDQLKSAEHAFYQNMMRRGVKVQTKEGLMLTPKEMPPQEAHTGQTQRFQAPMVDENDPAADRYVIDLDIEEVDAREIDLRDPRTGEITTIRIPAPKMDAAFMVMRYERQIAQTFDKMAKVTSENEAARYNNMLNDLYIKMVRLMVPDAHPEFLKTLKMRVVRQIVAVGNEMIASSMAMASTTPLTYVRHIYTLIEKPKGDNDRGLLLWLKEHFSDIEEVYGANPNE
jgi:hypothetical protein